MEYKKMLRALSDVEEQRNISEAVILEVGGKIRRPIEEVELSRAAVSIAKNVIRQKIREA